MRAERSFIWEKSGSVPLTLCSASEENLGMSSSQLIMENNPGAVGGSFWPLLHGTKVFFHHINVLEMPGMCRMGYAATSRPSQPSGASPGILYFTTEDPFYH